MELNDLLHRLDAAGVKLWLEEDQLRSRAPKGAITQELREALRAQKEKVIDFLRGLQNRKKQEGKSLPPLQPVSRKQTLPLSFAQQRLWFLHELTGSVTYHIGVALRMRGALNSQALENALNALIQRHESLRTCFPLVQSEPIQSILEPQHIRLEAEGVEESALEQKLAGQRKIAFDLESGPLHRVGLFVLDKEEHVLLWVQHHIITDGWSLGVLFQELKELYEAYCLGKSSPLTPLALQYADYSVWEREWLKDEVLAAEQDYWQKRLTGAPTMLELPTDHVRPAISSYRGEHYFQLLSVDLTKAVQELSRQQGSTLFMTLLAVFEVLLYRMSGQEDFCIGTPVAHRQQAELEKIIGCFVNTLVLRSDVDQSATFSEVLQRVKANCLEAYEHQSLPFEWLVEYLGLERSLTHHPVFQVSFALQNTEQDCSNSPWMGLQVAEQRVAGGIAKFDLSLAISEIEKGLQCIWGYATDLFDAETIECMAGHFEVLLRSIVANADAKIGKLPLLTEVERQQLLVEWNDIKHDYPKDKCIHQLFEEQVEKMPDAIAVVYEDEQLTYAELNARSNQLAHCLIKQGIIPETLVGIYVERSLEMVIGLLGILKAGGAYVPLDPSYPKDRLSFMLEDAGIKVLLTQEHIKESLSSAVEGKKIIALDQDWQEIASYSAYNPGAQVHPHHLAYVIYTSGSTGKPKGVLIGHHNVVRLFQATQHWFHFNQEDTWTLFHSIAFDFSVWELWGALLYGGRLIVVSYLTSRSPKDFYQLLCQEKVTVLNQTPSAFQQLIAVDANASQSEKLALRWIIFGGEALKFTVLKPWFHKHGDSYPTLVNMYGITETTVHVTYRVVTSTDALKPASLIGERIPDLSLYILDAHGQPSPIGIPGELHVGGMGLARGYLNRPELTAEKFIENPFGEGGLYKTGDLARWLPMGDIEYLGRIDHQVKLRGFRIELGEIESSITQHPRVSECVVIAREDQPGRKQLVAYLTASGTEELQISNVRLSIAEHLPDYMIPTAWVVLETFPLTPNGKVNRRALPAPEGGRGILETAYLAPRSPEEELLAGIWQEVLKVERVGIQDNFFALGGDSILSIQIVAKARAGGLSFSLADLFQRQTIETLLGSVTSEGATASKSELDAIIATKPFELIEHDQRSSLPEDAVDAYPTAAFQLEMLLETQRNRQQSVYQDMACYRIRADFDREYFCQALNRLTANHPILRTSFHALTSILPLQVVHAEASTPLEVEDLASLSTETQEAAVDTWIVEQKTQPFDYAKPPLLRCKILLCSKGIFYLNICFHHAILDGWSLASMLTELVCHYLGKPFEQGSKVAYRDFIALEQKAIASAGSRNYWLEKLSKVTAAPLPRPSQPLPSVTAAANWREASGVLELALEKSLLEQVQNYARELQVPTKHIFLAAHVKWLSQWTQQSEVSTGLLSNGRPEIDEGERTLGLFLNIIPLLVFVEKQMSDANLIKRTFQAEQEALPHRRFPYKLLEEARGQPLFETAFNFIHFHVYQSLREVKGWQFLSGKFLDKFSFPLSMHLVFNAHRGGKSEGIVRIEYDTYEFSAQEVKMMGQNYITILRELRI